MRKIISSIVLAALATTVVSASELADAFKNGKVSGDIQAFYFDRDTGSKSANILSTGLDLSFETAKYHGFGFKGTMQSTASPFATENAKDVYNRDMYGSGATLSEAYLSYGLKKTNVKLGRMFLDIPLVNGSRSRITQEAFEGVVVTSNDLPDTTITAAYIQKFQSRTDGNGNIGKFTKRITTSLDPVNRGPVLIEDGAYQLSIVNNSIKGLTLASAYVDLKNTGSVAYADATYKGNMSDFRYGVGTQYYYSDYDDGTDSSLVGLKASFGIAKFDFEAAYTTTSKDAMVLSGLGNGPIGTAYTASPILNYPWFADTDSYSMYATYKVMSSSELSAGYYNNDYKSRNEEVSYSYVGGSHMFDGELKGLMVLVQYEVGGKDSNENELRFYANYHF